MGVIGWREMPSLYKTAPVDDERNLAILAERVAAYDAIIGPRVGDFVRFPDGRERRISHIWDWDDDPDTSVQTSDSGSYYLGNGYLAMSGGLYCGVPGSTLTLTEETREGWVWFFHHNFACAHNGVDYQVTFRLYECSREAPRA